MTATPMNLVELGAAGAPLGELFDSLYARPDSHRLHGDAFCVEGLTRFNLDVLTQQRQAGRGSEDLLHACTLCQTGRVASAVDETLRAFSRLHDYHSDFAHYLALCAESMAVGGPQALAVASDSLSRLRLFLDPAVVTAGTPDIARETGQLPPGAAQWRDSYLRLAVAEFTALRERYRALGVLAAELSRESGVSSPVGPVGDWYVVDFLPTAEVPSGSTLMREAQLVYSPLACFAPSTYPGVLYRMPAALVAQLMLTDGKPCTLDGGPVRPGDTEDVLAAAAAIFDGSTAGAPFADPAVVINLARQLLAS